MAAQPSLEITDYELVQLTHELIDYGIRLLRPHVQDWGVKLTHDGSNLLFMDAEENYFCVVDPSFLANINGERDMIEFFARMLRNLNMAPPAKSTVDDYSRVY